MLRSLLSILLLTVFGLPFFTPLLAMSRSAEAGLPACCRRNGAHHCVMGVAERRQRVTEAARGPQFRAPVERCPYCPASIMTAHGHERFATAPAQAFYAAVVSHPSGTVQTESKRRISLDRSRQKRGPPSFLS